MFFYTIFFMFFQALFYFCVGSFAVFLLGIISGLVKPADTRLVFEACAVLIVLSPICRFMATQIHRKIKLLSMKGAA